MKEILFTTLEQFKTAVDIYLDDFLENNSIDPDMDLTLICSEITGGYACKLVYNISLAKGDGSPYSKDVDPEWSDRAVFLRYDMTNRDLRERLVAELEEISKVRVAA
jgi:hypothetical protein